MLRALQQNLRKKCRAALPVLKAVRKWRFAVAAVCSTKSSGGVYEMYTLSAVA
jgi:hypothetical protein